MKYFKSFVKISILLMLLVVSLGSIYAAEDADLDLDLDDEDFDDDINADLDDDDFDDEQDGDNDEYSDSDDDFEDSYGDDNEDVELDENDSYYTYSDFDYLKFKITHYLYRYGNCSEYNWTESDEFINEYQIYLINPSNYTLNESSEGYQTYLKIFDSITSTFKDYNLTENETGYLKFMVIFYLNHYGNVSANYTWNESESFANYTPPIDLLGAFINYKRTNEDAVNLLNNYFNSINFKSPVLTNSTYLNSTSHDNISAVGMENDDSMWNYIIILILVLVLVVMVII